MTSSKTTTISEIKHPYPSSTITPEMKTYLNRPLLTEATIKRAGRLPLVDSSPDPMDTIKNISGSLTAVLNSA